MAYRLKSDRPVAAELKRVARKQLTRAAADLTAAGARLRCERVHSARKRVKKVRAILRLAAPWVSKRTVRQTNARLRKVSGRLGWIADAGATVAAFDRLARAHSNTISRRTTSLLRRALQQRDSAIRREAGKKQISARCEHVLLREARRSKDWLPDTRNVTTLLPGLERSQRRGRQAMKNAWDHPDAARLHAWRRRVKDEWLQLRLLDGSSEKRLSTLRGQLESLDSVLGEYHDLALLRLALEDSETLTREQAAAVLRVIAQGRRRLRRRARLLGARIYGEVPA